MEFVGTAKFSDLHATMFYINYCNSFSSPNHIQVLNIVNQPRSQNITANGNCCNYKNARRGRTTDNEKKVVCKRVEISTTSSTNLLYSIFPHAKRLQRPGAGKMAKNMRG